MASTSAQFSVKSPTIKRILKEASELSNAPSPDYAAAPLETNLFEWHFTLRGPPAPSAFDGGLYHGRIILPPAYPLRPPSFRFLTPSGRFEVNREICLSISGFHEETWQPAWGIRTALIAIRSFMDTDAMGQMGGLMQPDETRKRLARESVGWKCMGCTGKTCGEMIREVQEACERLGTGKSAEKETVPEELRLVYRDQMDKDKQVPAGPSASKVDNVTVGPIETKRSEESLPASENTQQVPNSTQAARPLPRQDGSPWVTVAWLDAAIVIFAICLLLTVLRVMAG